MSVSVGNLRIATVASLECSRCHKMMVIDITTVSRQRMVPIALKRYNALGWNLTEPVLPVCPFCEQGMRESSPVLEG